MNDIERRRLRAMLEAVRAAQPTGQVHDPREPATLWIGRLPPLTPMVLFATVTDSEGRESRPSAPRMIVLRDEFPFT